MRMKLPKWIYEKKEFNGMKNTKQTTKVIGALCEIVIRQYVMQEVEKELNKKGFAVVRKKKASFCVK